MAVIHVNDKPVDIGNERLNLIQAALRIGLFIPYYCWHPALTVVASCRMCMVEVGERKPDGSVAMQPRVVPACQTLAKDGMFVLSNSPKARSAQRLTLEGYPPRNEGWISEGAAVALERVPLLVVQDLFPSPASNRAHYVVPAVSFAEKDGTFVNHANLAQAIHWAVAPTTGCRSDGQVFLDLLGRRGLVHAPSLRRELAREIANFARLTELDEPGPQVPHSPGPSGFYAPPSKGGPGEYGVWLGD